MDGNIQIYSMYPYNKTNEMH